MTRFQSGKPHTGPQNLLFTLWAEGKKDELARVFVPLEDRRGGFVEVEELAMHTGLCVKTIRREISDGNLIAHRIRGRVIVKVSDVLAWLSARREV